MKGYRGMTLVEILVGMVLLTIVLMSTVTGMSNLYIMMSSGKDITRDSFDGQMDMENALVTAKSSFSANHTNITIFSGTAYQKSIPIQHVQTVIAGNRTYDAYISQTPIVTPPAPNITSFGMNVYETGTNTLAFPWIEDNIQLKGYFTLGTSPQVYETRTRWYRSPSTMKPVGTTIWTPIYTSQFVQHSEIVRNTSFVTDTQYINRADLLANNFYHFEIMPYTLAGKVAQRVNPNRIAILSKTASTYFNDLMEAAYFDTLLLLNTADYPTAYTDTMNNAERPTLHIESNQNVPMAGSIVAAPLSGIAGKNLITVTASMQFDPLTYTNTSGDMQAGFMFGGVSGTLDTGHLLEMDVKNNVFILNYIENGAYKPAYVKSVLSTSALNNANFTFDWTKEYKYNFIIDKNANKLSLQLTDTGGVNSETLDFSTLIGFNITHLGIKAYSPLNYDPVSEYELLGQYFRNYTLHIYQIDASGSNVVIPDVVYSGDYFLRTADINIEGSSDITSTNSTLLIDAPTKTQVLKGDNDYTIKNVVFNTNIRIEGSSSILSSEDVYIAGNVEIANGGASIDGRQVYIRGDVTFSEGGYISATEDLVIDGNVYLNRSGPYAGILRAKRIYISGDVIYNRSNVIKGTESVMVGGQVTTNVYYGQIQSDHIDFSNNPIASGGAFTFRNSTNTADVTPILSAYNPPNIAFVTVNPIPTSRDVTWYTAKQYHNNIDAFSLNYVAGTPALASNRRIVVSGDYTYTLLNQEVQDVVIVALNGNINITLNNQNISGLFYAPNGSITINGARSGWGSEGLKGTFISRDTMTITPNDVKVFERAINLIIGNNPDDIPFQ